MISTLLHRTLLIASAAVVSLLLIRKLGMWPALGVWAAGTALMCIIGTVLLRTSALGRVTWKNRVASYMIPWGGRLNRGRLWPIPVVSWGVWMLIAAAVAALVDKEDTSNTLKLNCLFIAWIVDGAAVFHFAGTLSQQWEWRSRGMRTLMKLLLGIVGLLVASTVCFAIDDPTSALVIAGGPPLVLTVIFGLYFGVLILAGRNARWN